MGFECEPQLLERMDARAREMGLGLSEYICHVVREDLCLGGKDGRERDVV